jgi:uncharacterized protein YbaP (TraB family)
VGGHHLARPSPLPFMRTIIRLRHLVALGATLVLSTFVSTTLGQEPAARPAPQPEAPATRVPFLYELQGHGATAFLFGTVHLPDARVVELPEVVERAFLSADAVYTELEMTGAAEREGAKAGMLPEETSLPKIIGPDLMQRLEARLSAAELPARMFDQFQPWAVSAMLPILPVLHEMGLRPALDKTLYQRAGALKKTVGGLETVAEQAAVFAGLSVDEQRALVRDGLDLLDQHDAAGRNGLEELVQAWLSGKLERLLDLLEEGFGPDEALRRKLEDRIVWDRNRRFAERIDTRIQAAPTQVAFFAVGALHLPDGRVVAAADTSPEALAAERQRMRGLLTLLREAGYTVVHRTKVEAAPVEAR